MVHTRIDLVETRGVTINYDLYTLIGTKLGIHWESLEESPLEVFVRVWEHG